MPRVEFERWNWTLRVEGVDDGNVRIDIDGSPTELLVSREQIHSVVPDWLGGQTFSSEVFDRHESTDNAGPHDPEWKYRISRIVLHIGERNLAGFDWERLVAPAMERVRRTASPDALHSTLTVVRASGVRPRALNSALALPLRVLHVSPRPEHTLADWVRALFGNHPRELVDQAILVETSGTWQTPDGWPTVDVVHLDDLPVLADPGTALSTALSSPQGSLGWITRWTHRWQTRLLVINPASPAEAAVARCLAHAVCNKGGPAVLVVESTNHSAGFFQRFYDLLIHDCPLDWIVGDITPSGMSVVLFAGAGREEALRPSNIAIELVSLAARPRRARPFRFDTDQAFRFDEALRAVSDDWKTSRYDVYEGEGLLPLAERIGRLRSIARGDDRIDVIRGRPKTRPSTGPRVVNSSLWSDTTGSMELISQKRSTLTLGATYFLQLSIGPKEKRVEILNLQPLIEEQFKWLPGAEGVWVEFGVTGIDFSLTGDPVQPLWLPRSGATEPLYFSVVPQVPGVAQLRFGLYYEHNLLQSFRLAAIVGEAFEGDRAAALAAALGVEKEKIGDAGYMARLEYSRSSSLQEVARSGGRALSITANRLEGKNILTIKGDDVFHVEVYPDKTVRDAVTNIRQTVDGISYVRAGTSTPIYQFGPFGDAKNKETRFDEAMVKLASAGVDLFTTLAPGSKKRDEIARCLAGSRKVIQVAPLLRDKVIPWAFVYDRLYDENAGKIDGTPVEQGVCRASLPQGKDSNPRANACGGHVECLLNPALQAERQRLGLPLYHERTVACPLHFWGFSHIIEVPPQQVEDGESAREERTEIVPSGSPLLVAGLNQFLDPQQEHWTTVSGIGKWSKAEYARDAIIDLLRNPDLDLIYFFCHARGGEVEDPRIYPPYLEFGSNDPRARIKPKDLAADVTWKHAPLVVLNACGTLGYSPDALSPFLKALVDDRGAGGILGTEVPVAEILATDVARAFFERFVSGKRAGEALLDVRWELLSARNPLGLVYTLFAPAALALDISGSAAPGTP